MSFPYDQPLQSGRPVTHRRQNYEFSVTDHGASSGSADSFLAVMSRLHSYCDRERFPVRDQYSYPTSQENNSVQQHDYSPPCSSYSGFSPVRDEFRSQGSVSSSDQRRKTVAEGLCRSSHEGSYLSNGDPRKSRRLSNFGSRSLTSTHSSRKACPETSEADDEEMRLRAHDVRGRARLLQAESDLNLSTLPRWDHNPDIVQTACSEINPIRITSSMATTSSHDAYDRYGNLMPVLSNQLPMPTVSTSDVSLGAPHVADMPIAKMLPAAASSRGVLPLTHSTVTGSSDRMSVFQLSQPTCDRILRFSSNVNGVKECALLKAEPSSGYDTHDINPTTCKDPVTFPVSSITSEGRKVAAAKNNAFSQSDGVPAMKKETFKFNSNRIKIRMEWIGSMQETMKIFTPDPTEMLRSGEKFDHVGFFIECFQRMSVAPRKELQHVAMILNRAHKSKHFRLREPVRWTLSKLWHCSASVNIRRFNGYGGLPNSAILNALGSAFPDRVVELRVFARDYGFLGWKLAQEQYKTVSVDQKYDAVRAKLWAKLNEVFFLKSAGTTYLQKDTGQLVFEKLQEVVGMVLGEACLLINTGPVCVEVQATLKQGDDEQVLTGTHFSMGSASLSLISSIFDASQLMKFLDDLTLLLGAGSLIRNAYNQVAVDFYWDLLLARIDFLASLCQSSGNLDPAVKELIKFSPDDAESADVLKYLVADDAYYYNLLDWMLGERLGTDTYQTGQFAKMWSICVDRCTKGGKMYRTLSKRTAVDQPWSKEDKELIDSILGNFADPKIFITKVCQSNFACHMVESVLFGRSRNDQRHPAHRYCVSKIQDYIAITPYTPLCGEMMLGNDERPLLYENVNNITGLLLGQVESQKRVAFIRSMCQGDHKDSKLAKIIERCIKPSQFEAALDVAARDILYVPEMEQLHNIPNQEWWNMAFWQNLAEDVAEEPDLMCPPDLVLDKLRRMKPPKSTNPPGVIARSVLSKRKSEDSSMSPSKKCKQDPEATTSSYSSKEKLIVGPAVSKSHTSELSDDQESRLAKLMTLMGKHQNGPYYHIIVETPSWTIILKEVVQNDYFYTMMLQAVMAENCVKVGGINAMKIWHDLAASVTTGLVFSNERAISGMSCFGEQALTSQTFSLNNCTNVDGKIVMKKIWHDLSSAMNSGLVSGMGPDIKEIDGEGSSGKSLLTNQTFNVKGSMIAITWNGSLTETLERFIISKDASVAYFDLAGFFVECFDRMPDDFRTNLHNVLLVVNECIQKKTFQFPEPTFCRKSKIWHCCISSNETCFSGYGRFLNTAVLNALGLACPEKLVDLRHFARDYGFIGWKLARKQYQPFTNAKLKVMLWTELNDTFFLRQTCEAYSRNGCQMVYDNLKKVAGVILGNSSVKVTPGSLCVDIAIVYKDAQNMLKSFSGTHFSTGSACLTLISSMFTVTEVMKFLDELMLLLGGGTLKRDSSNQVAIDFYWDLLLARVDFVKEFTKTRPGLLKYFDEKCLGKQAYIWDWLVADDSFYYNLIGWLVAENLRKVNSLHHEEQFLKMWTQAAARYIRFAYLSKLLQQLTKCHVVPVGDTPSDEVKLFTSFPNIFEDPKIFITKMCESNYLYQALKSVLSTQSVGKTKAYSKSGALLNVSIAKDCISISPYATLNPEIILGNPARALLYKHVNGICGLAVDQLKGDQFRHLINSICRDRPSITIVKVIQTHVSKDPVQFESVIETACRDVLYPLAMERWIKSCHQGLDRETQLIEEKYWHASVWQALVNDAPKMPDLRWPADFVQSIRSQRKVGASGSSAFIGRRGF